MPDPRCRGCGRAPEQIGEYREAVMADIPETDPGPVEMTWMCRLYVEREEGTYNRATGGFWCTACYCRVGMPLGVAP